MRGLALEGGGARGAYHIGVAKAYLENGYVFDGYVGTSIGAINAAVLAQGDFDTALALWTSLSMERLFDLDEKRLVKLSELKLNKDFLSNLRIGLKRVLDEGGVDTARMKSLVESIIQEDRVRASSKDFGLVTVSTGERKPYELFLEDIPQGELIRYIMASACFPGFKPEIIDGKTFMDGGIYNNCPVNLLLEKGYDEIVAVRTHAPGRFRHVKADAARITLISPSDPLGPVMIFSPEQIQENITQGYFDGLRAIRNLRGQYYYLEPVNPRAFGLKLMSLEEDALTEIGRLLKIPPSPVHRMLFEQIVPQLGTYLKLKKGFDYGDFIIGLLEHRAKQEKLGRYNVYKYEEFAKEVKALVSSGERERKLLAGKNEMAIEKFVMKILMKEL